MAQDGPHNNNLTLWDYFSVLLRQWPVLILSIVLAMAWALNSYEETPPKFETWSSIQIIPPQSREAIFKDVSNVFSKDRTLEAQEKYLASASFQELAAKYIMVEQAAKARMEGSSRLWPKIDEGIQAFASDLETKYSIVRDDHNQILNLTFWGETEEQAATISEVIPRLFKKTNASRVNRKGREARNFIRKKLREFEGRAADLTQRIWDLRGSANAYTHGEQSLLETEKRLAETVLKRELAEADLSEYREQIENIRYSETSSADARGEIISRLNSELLDLEFHRALLLRNYTAAHPEVDAVSQEIARTRETLEQHMKEVMADSPQSLSPFEQYRSFVGEAIRLEMDLRNMERRELALTGKMEGDIEQARNVALFNQELSRVDSELAYFRRLWQTFHQKLVNLDLSIELDREGQGYVEILNPAVRAPKDVSQSNLARHFSVWSIFGVLVGIIFAFFLDYNDTSLKTEVDVRRWLGLPLLSAVPSLKEIRKKTFRDILPEFEQGRQTMEAFRTLRTQVEFKAIDKPLKTLLITSTRPSEGKTAIMTNLAVTFAQKGERVLLVDCDLRRPALHRHMNLDRSPGLSNILLNEIGWEGALQETDVPNLWVMAAGDMTVNPSELLSSEKMKEMVKTFSSEYDRVLFDMSSVLAVTDSAIMGSLVDGVLLVVKAYKTPRHYVQQSIEIMNSVGSNFLGVVFNQVKRYGSAYYYYHYYHHERNTGRGRA